MKTPLSLSLASVVVAVLTLTSCSTESPEVAEEVTGADVSMNDTVGGPLCGPIDESAERAQLAVINSPSAITEPVILWGIQEGCFQKHGLDIESIPNTGSGAEKIASLIGGSAHIASESNLEFFAAVANGSTPLSIIAGGNEVTSEDLALAKSPELIDGKPVLGSMLFVRQDYPFEGLESLRGARIGGSPGVSVNGMGLIQALKSVGVESAEAEFVGLGTTERLDALERGDVDAATFPDSAFARALAMGARPVLYPGAYLYEPSMTTLWFTTADIADERETDIRAFQTALREIHELIMNPENHEAYLAFLGGEYGLSSEALDYYRYPVLGTRDVTIGEFEYLIPILVEEGLIDEPIVLSDELLFR